MTTMDVASVDHALSTTRAVRRRLDLERPVDLQILLDCIDVAEQAPSGGNQGSRRWVIVADQAVKDQLAELYMQAAGQWMIESSNKIAGTGHPQERVMASAAYLAEHLAEVPAIVIPTIIGVHDGSGRPGLFDSVIQAVWSFSVALRARGLGSAWTTANLSRQDDIADLLGIPGGMTQIAMLPVAWTKGTDFKRAPRYPARAIAYFDGFGRTWESGPSDPPRFADGPGIVVETDVKASAELLWPYVTDIDFSAQFSDEFTGGRWIDDASGLAVGARFVGSNANAAGTWDVDCFVDRCEINREFGWVTADPEHPAARWRLETSSIAGGTRLRYSVVLGPGPSRLTAAIERRPNDEAHLIAKRLETLRSGMAKVIAGMGEAAERDAATARARRKAGGAPPPLG